MGSDREVVDNIYGAKGYEESEYVCEREEKNRQCAASIRRQTETKTRGGCTAAYPGDSEGRGGFDGAMRHI